MIEKMFIRVRKDGFIYPFSAQLAKNPACEVVTEREAYPERFATSAVEKARRRSKKLALETDDIPEAPVYTSPELSADASRNLPE